MGQLTCFLFAVLKAYTQQSQLLYAVLQAMGKCRTLTVHAASLSRDSPHSSNTCCSSGRKGEQRPGLPLRLLPNLAQLQLQAPPQTRNLPPCSFPWLSFHVSYEGPAWMLSAFLLTLSGPMEQNAVMYLFNTRQSQAKSSAGSSNYRMCCPCKICSFRHNDIMLAYSMPL